MNAETAQVDDLRLVALPSAVNCADLFARFTLAEWSLRRMADDAAHTVTQLVTSIVDNADSRSSGFVVVRLRLHGDRLVIEVEHDQSERSPALPPALADVHTGTVPLQDRGTLVRCELPLPEGTTASDIPLPRRDTTKSRTPEQATDAADDVDPQLMQRLLSGLTRPSPEGAAE